ncbi:hypothetical protein COW36_17735 [bacterium (Candidatus Blackallbacteria) CG17_big_fil_post_rev_8_21_14_2_50_48_46]|uniref:Uncharacterized protein n=1 Tax=bacterium (Candidatus Blackallbacteria) CG17_big_fil_post_rev_8_21_14_2_50_48_46 TaxID=2014261 RepID=A0A2M7G0Q4_9BACT|nr:MAG: hypothetical protein COW64_00990 [bacterium (Candidatus Blackallbacteria) CG18_big_fil_WC_8_21_14_2_50_49_26]PIW15259.1 MAG: hypothetical protein COW36_17735 [bacterium (Candidatus Blackallbacteria) CG17_big_fil_post_rev_8_21_14_2_50_48_46]PIW45232.1 MAG: hypothetical protein COW20_21280 [bacterium (Candidatus Blackallbacteria) CG13_big_fil_rev_8_21_14_2_50_49_14]
MAESVSFELDLDWVSRYLPHQGALQHFVHHNPLAAFESLPFEVACQQARELYGGYCFLEQKRYLEYLQQGKIALSVLASELRAWYSEQESLSEQELQALLQVFLNPPRLSLKNTIEKKLLQEPRQALLSELKSLIAEVAIAEPISSTLTYPTYREVILAQKGVDIDTQINPLMAKFFSAYADPGCAYWKVEYKREGLWACFLENYRSPYLLENTFARMLHLELFHSSVQDLNPDQALLYYLEALQLQPENYKKYLLAMGLRLRGWAGLFNQMEHEPEQRLDGTSFVLKEFLLVKLVFEYVACKAYLPRFEEKVLLYHQLERAKQKQDDLQAEWLYLSLHFFDLHLGPGEWQASPTEKKRWLHLLRVLLKEQRKLIYQRALEKTYALEVLSVFKQVKQLEQTVSSPPAFQYITCIDDREESLRRYIEAQVPDCETFGVAGYFEMNMYFQAHNEVRSRKLCPGVIQETFQVQQVKKSKAQVSLSQTYARVFRSYSTHSKISFFAYLITVVTGFLSAIPFFIKVFLPYLDLVLRQSIRAYFLPEQELEDLIFHEQGQVLGLSYAQAAEKVYQLLKTIDLLENFSEFIYVVGHGSSSINNPHEYAYNCGACGGGEGRANARVFATLANTPEVRTLLKANHALELPETTIFIAGYHDTCQDSLLWSEPSLTAQQKQRHAHYVAKMNRALKYNAAERARKFFNISKRLGILSAFKQVFKRSNDLAEARPEYNHATQALCVIGRRSLNQHIFFDRRAFLCSYNPDSDDGSVLAKSMAAVMPVCAGISLEYYFSSMDPEVYGCGSKLSHNITCDYAVMSGFASDLRLGLSKQMVEIHDPRRILFVIESEPEIVHAILLENPQLENLVKNRWVSLLVYHARTETFFGFQNQGFVPLEIPEAEYLSYVCSENIPTDASNLIPVALLERQLCP